MRDMHMLGPLLERVLAGQPGALDDLLGRLRPYLHLVVRRHFEPGQAGAVAESDIVQETLVKLHGALDPAAPKGGRFRGDSPPEFLAWVSEIVRNLIVDATRRGLAGKRDERREIRAPELFAALTQGSTPAQVVERAEKALLLAAALERLPPHQQQVLELRFFERLSYAEISQRTGKRVGALRVVATRALTALRRDEKLRQWMEAGS